MPNLLYFFKVSSKLLFIMGTLFRSFCVFDVVCGSDQKVVLNALLYCHTTVNHTSEMSINYLGRVYEQNTS